MSIFGSIRSLMSSKTEEEPSWIIPENKLEIDAVFNHSEKPQIFYKHSYRCSTALFTKNSLDTGIEEVGKYADMYLIDVVDMREISMYIAEKTGVKHESPQLILLQNGQPFWHTSHGEVQLENLVDAMNELAGTDIKV